MDTLTWNDEVTPASTNQIVEHSYFLLQRFPPPMLPIIPDTIDPLFYYLLVGAAVLITSISKSGFGGGVGILAIPLMAMAMGPQHMLGMLLPLLIACDLFGNPHYRGQRDWPRLRNLLSGAVVGIVIGTCILFFLSGMPPQQFGRVMTGLVGAICLAVVLIQVYRMTGRELPTLPPHPISAICVGVLAGALSTLNHAAGPIIVIYLLHVGLDKRKLVGTTLMYYLIGNTLKLPTYLLLEMPDGQTLINAQTLRDSIWFIPLIPIGTLMGVWMNKHIDEKPFTAILYIFAALSAGHIIYKAIG